MHERLKVPHRLRGWLLAALGATVGVGLLGASAAHAQADPFVQPTEDEGYYVPPGYTTEPPPPSPTPATQPYPAPQAQPYPAPQAQPYTGQQPYAQPTQAPYRGRRRMERLGRGDAVPPGVEVIERRRLVLSFVGLGLFAGAYILPVAVMFDGPYASRRVLVPVFGVLLENAHRDYLFGGSWGLAVLDAGVQAIGLTLFAVGMRQQRYAVYYVETGRGRTLALSPGVGPGGLAFNLAF